MYVVKFKLVFSFTDAYWRYYSILAYNIVTENTGRQGEMLNTYTIFYNEKLDVRVVISGK